MDYKEFKEQFVEAVKDKLEEISHKSSEVLEISKVAGDVADKLKTDVGRFVI